jgi:hypothetical protein
MKTSKFLATMGFVLTTLAGGTASAQQNTDFILINNTGVSVYSVYIWPTGITIRGSDQLAGTIESGESREFRPSDGGCMFNIRVVLENGHEQQWGNLNLCNLSKLTLSYNLHLAKQ